jgi:hypothetical protein
MKLFNVLLEGIGLAILLIGLVVGFEFERTMNLLAELGYELGLTLGGAFAVCGALTLGFACWRISPKQGAWVFHASAGLLLCLGLAMSVWPQAVLNVLPTALLRMLIILGSLYCGSVLFFRKAFTSTD